MKLFNLLKGDKTLWAITLLLALFSFLPVYSAGTQISVDEGVSVIRTLLFKHMFLLLAGFFLIYLTHKLAIERIAVLGWLFFIPVVALLAYTLTMGNSIGGVSANRWVRVPLINMNFQPSTLAQVVLMVCIASYLAKNKARRIKFSESILPLWIPIGLTVLLVFSQNFSTAAIIGLMAFVLCFIGGYPLKYLIGISLALAAAAALFLTVLMKSPESIPSDRAVTWKNRV